MMPAVPPPNDDVIVVTVAFEAKTHLKATQIMLVKSFSMDFENIFTFLCSIRQTLNLCLIYFPIL